jgi:hypothetical protein
MKSDEIKGYKIKYYDLFPACKGICIFWLKEVHIHKKYENTPVGTILIHHELQHAKFIEKILNIRKNSKLSPHSKVLKILTLTLENNIWDFFDCLKIELYELFYDLRKWIDSSFRPKS